MKEFEKLVKIVRTLRSKKGCAWDRAQKLGDLKNYLLEEVYELLDVLKEGGIEKIKEELGDVFLILVFIAQIFDEKKKFSIKDVLKKINTKLVTRHPHVFSSQKLKTKGDILRYWVNEKARTKRRKTVYQRLPKSAPSLLLAELLFREIRSLSRDFDVKKILERIKSKAEKLSVSKRKKENLLGLLLEASKFSSLFKFNLESLLRERVFQLAHKVKYRRDT
ncbi:MAG: hypothetical protein DRP81_04065 [Candidatus Omnitrophota bacterium]|nr:MAG: hypothetical protein DRP81_04065 [Candidatus Omnitrophota bacterium]